MNMGLLVAALSPRPEDEEEFNAWYDTEHIPERLRVPGFLGAQRWVAVAGEPRYLAIYDLQSLAVLDSPAYRAISGENFSPWSKRIIGRALTFQRWVMEQILPGDASAPAGAGGLLAVFLDVAPAAEAEFNDWYNQEHIPRLLQVPGVLAARRFLARSGQPRYLALYHLTDPAVATGAAWQEAVETPWTQRIRPHTHNRLRLLYRPCGG